MGKGPPPPAEPQDSPPDSLQPQGVPRLNGTKLKDLLALPGIPRRSEYKRMVELTAELLGVGLRTGKEWTAGDQAELQALLKEYESLRTESMNTITNRIQVMLVGLAVVGALAGGALTIDDPAARPVVILAIFSLAVPLICVFVLLAWVSEARRSARLGRYLATDVEPLINAKLGRYLMRWEAALWSGYVPRDEFGGPSMLTMWVFGLVGILSPPFGRIIQGRPAGPATWLSPELLAPWGVIVVAFLYALNLFRRAR